jgi:hypothetical protein
LECKIDRAEETERVDDMAREVEMDRGEEIARVEEIERGAGS